MAGIKREFGYMKEFKVRGGEMGEKEKERIESLRLILRVLTGQN